MVDAYESRGVATFDLPGSYLQAKMPNNKVVLLNFCGGMYHVRRESIAQKEFYF